MRLAELRGRREIPSMYPRHNWLGICERCGKEHPDMLEVFALNDMLRERYREDKARRSA